MEKAIETDWRCQSTTWKFLQKVGNAVIGKRRMREEEEVEGKNERKNHFRYWNFGVRAATNTATHQVTTLEHSSPPSHTCMRTNWILWLFWNMRTKYNHFSLHFDAFFVFCTYISMQLLQVGVIFPSMDYVWFGLFFFNGQHQYGTSGTIRSW